MPRNNRAVKACCRRPKPCRKCFVYFGRLPPELRHMIWTNAIQDPTPGRFVVFDGYAQRIIPTAGLVAPLLLVNRESRHLALRHYTLRIAVHEVRQCTRSHPLRRSEESFQISELGAERVCLYLHPIQDPVVVNIQYADFKEPGKYKWEKPYYRYTTKQIEPDNCVLTPSCLVIVGDLLRRSDPADLRKFKRCWKRQRYDCVLILKDRPPLITPEEFIECLPKWDVDSLRKLGVAVNRWEGINRRSLKIRKKAITNGVKSPPKSQRWNLQPVPRSAK
ncbi:hypothetical protein PG984_008526 [Apiospora sp. TS-2023a]